MENTATKAKYNLAGFSDTALNTQSILDVFVLQDVIDPEDAEKLKAHFRTNREVENFLIKNRLVSKDTINKAYSIILKVPFISLANVEIPQEALSIIPKNLVSKYGILPFDLRNNLVRLAVCKPADMLVGYTSGLSKIFDSKNLAIEIFITGESDFNEAIKQLNKNKQNKLLIKKGSLPVIQLRNFNISSKYINKIPKEFIEKYRIVVFEENVVGDYLIACEFPDSVVTKKVLDYIEKENKVSLEVFATSKDDLDYVLEHYVNGVDLKAEEKKKAPLVSPTQPEKEKVEEKKENQEQPKSTIGFSLDNLFKNVSSKSGITIDSISDEQTAKNEKKDQNGQEKKTTADEETEFGINYNSNGSKRALEEAKKVEPEEKTESSVAAKDSENKTNKSDSDQKISLGRDVMEAKDLGMLLSQEVKDEKDLQEVIDEGYVPKMVAAILDYALNKKVSDIHIEPQAKVLRIRIRIDGILADTIKMSLKYHPPIISRIKIISRLKIDETRIPQDGRFDVVLGKREIDVRVSTLPTVHGEKIVLRVLDKSQKVLSLEDLGMQGTGFDKTIEAISKPWGIILSTGPTGSGKSTTLNAIINRLNMPGVNISTLEDPVEYETPGVNQTQVKPEIGFTFAAGLRSLLRQDPNIIMVGEIRDGETAGMATHAALTGHLVLSTLHTNDTAGTLPRLINMGIEPFLITSSINLVVAQRLIRKICPKCKEETKLPPRLIDEVKSDLDKIAENNIKDRGYIPKEFRFYYGRGCNECTQGYKGRIGLFEVMNMSPAIEDLAINKRPSNEIKLEAIRGGMITMKQDGIIKALQGITTIDEVLQATSDK